MWAKFVKTNPFEAVNCAHVFAEVFIFLLFHHKWRDNTKRSLLRTSVASYNSVTGVYSEKVAENIVEIVEFSDPTSGHNSSKPTRLKP